MEVQGRKAMVDFMVVLCIARVCVGYLIFIGNTLSYMFTGSKPQPNPKSQESLLNPHGVYLSTSLDVTRKVGFIWAIFPLELIMSGIRTLTHLAPFSVLAYTIYISAMLTVVVQDVLSILSTVGPDVHAFTGFSAIPYGVGVAIYAFDGVSMILPLELAMEKKHRFGGVLAVAFLFIALIYGKCNQRYGDSELGEKLDHRFCSDCLMSEPFLHISTDDESCL